jgi:hypothetical protein
LGLQLNDGIRAAVGHCSSLEWGCDGISVPLMGLQGVCLARYSLGDPLWLSMGFMVVVFRESQSSTKGGENGGESPFSESWMVWYISGDFRVSR